jgi:hypothetical protein
MKLALLTAVQLQPEPAVTATVPVPPSGPKLLELGAAAVAVQVGVAGFESFFEQAPATIVDRATHIKSLVEHVMSREHTR